MGTISSSIGLVSGINSQQIIEQLLALESRPLQSVNQRIGTLRQQQTALLDVNARLVAFKGAASSFRTNDLFDAVAATSSNEEAVGVTARSAAQPGSYAFTVRQLVSTSQSLSRGFATRDESPLGLDGLSFEFGNGRLAREVALEDLNGGLGVDRGSIVVTDRSGATATIDLSDALTLDEVIETINDSSGVSVSASIDGDGLVISDLSGGSGSLTVADGTGDTTATDLGIAGTTAGATLTGATTVNVIGGDTALSTLNDGRGVLVVNGSPDLTITARDGDVFDVDFGRIDEDIDGTTLLEDLNDGDGVRFDADSDTADVTFVARDGTEYDVDLSGLTTVQGLIDRVDTETGGVIALAVNATGDGFDVTDSSGGTGLFRVIAPTDGDTDVAEDLGLLEEDGVAADTINGVVIPSTIDRPRATTLQEIVDRINDAVDNTGGDNAGRIVASIGADGRSLLIEDNTGSTASNLIIESTGSSQNPTIAEDLGIATTAAGVASNSVAGSRLIGDLDSVLLSSLNGGDGLGASVTTLTVQDRDGATTDVLIDPSSYDTVSELLDFVNQELSDNAVDVTIALNASQNGFQATDTSGGAGNLQLSNDGADVLGLTADVADTVVRGANAQRAYVTRATLLEDLNEGRGIGTGTFRITDGLGASFDVRLDGTERTVQELLVEINGQAGAAGAAVTARINDNGDGIVLEEDAGALGGDTPFRAISVASVSGTTARDLNLLGEADGVSQALDGSYERFVDLDSSDSLNEVVSKINDAGIPVSATVLTTGSGGTPFRLNLTSSIEGARGDMVIDTGGVDLGLSVLARGQDAKILVGGGDSDERFLVTSDSNSVDGVIDGLTLELKEVTDDPVTITVRRDEGAIEEGIESFVGAFNNVIGGISEYDFFDVDTLERGPLLGDSTLATVRSSLYRTLNSRPVGVSGSFQFLTQVGLTVNREGQIAFDAGRFREAYAQDPEGVEALFAAYETSSGTTTEIADGVTIPTTNLEFSALGKANQFDELLDDLTNSIDGLLTRADESFDDRIRLLQSRAEDLDARLEARREVLTRQFTQLELTISQLQNQGAALQQIASVPSVSIGG